MRVAVLAAGLVIGVAGASSAAASGDTPPSVPAPAVVEDTVPSSPPTTSEFGTETEIVIALDDDGNVVPG